MGLFGFLGKKEKAEPVKEKEKKPQPEEVEQYSGMRVEVMTAEERLLLQNLTVTDCLFEDTTVLDQFTIQGMLPAQKEELLQAMAYLLSLQAM